MMITNAWLLEAGACGAGRDWFYNTFPYDQPVELRVVLTKLYLRAAAGAGLGSSYGWPCWVMDHASIETLREALPSDPSRIWTASWADAKQWCLGSSSDYGGAAALQRLDSLIQRFLELFDGKVAERSKAASLNLAGA